MFISLLPFISYLNVFHINEPILGMTKEYYLKHIIELIIIIFIGIKKQRHFL